MLKDIIEVKPLNDYQLYLKFEDDRDGIIDLKEIIEFVGIFEPLKELAFFKTVKINPDWGTIYWENGADLDPDVLYSIITDQSLNSLETNNLQWKPLITYTNHKNKSSVSQENVQSHRVPKIW
jgi:ribosomal protein S16